LSIQENIDKGAKDEDTENMQIQDVITKNEDTNPESTKAIQEQAIMEDTKHMQIEEVITKNEFSFHVSLLFQF
jgi:hypothetical protein